MILLHQDCRQPLLSLSSQAPEVNSRKEGAMDGTIHCSWDIRIKRAIASRCPPPGTCVAQDMFTLKSYSLFIQNSYATDCPVVLLADSGALACVGEGMDLGLPGNLCLRPVKATQGSSLSGPDGPHGLLFSDLPFVIHSHCSRVWPPPEEGLLRSLTQSQSRLPSPTRRQLTQSLPQGLGTRQAGVWMETGRLLTFSLGLT